MRKIITGVPFAMVASIVLVVLGATLATAPATRDGWVGHIIAAVALFAAILYAGTAIRRRRSRRR
jgi:membrane protein DedA with SNARE-associated domain